MRRMCACVHVLLKVAGGDAGSSSIGRGSGIEVRTRSAFSPPVKHSSAEGGVVIDMSPFVDKIEIGVSAVTDRFRVERVNSTQANSVRDRDTKWPRCIHEKAGNSVLCQSGQQCLSAGEASSNNLATVAARE